MSPRPGPARRVGLPLQLGQTLVVLGAAILVVGLLLRGGGSAVVIGAVLLVAGVVLFAVGLRRRSAVGPSSPDG